MKKEQSVYDVRGLPSEPENAPGLRLLTTPINVASPLLINLVLFLYFIALPFCLTDAKQEYYFTLIVSLIGFTSINVGLLINIGQGRQFFDDHMTAPTVVWGKVAVVLVIAFVTNDLSRIFRFFFDGINQAAYHEIYGNAKSWQLYLLILWVALIFCKYYFYSKLMANSRQVFWTLFVISLLAAIPGRARFELISVAVFFIVYGSLNGYLKLKLYHLILGLMMALIMMPILLIKRNIVGEASFFGIWHLVFDKLANLWSHAGFMNELLISMESPATFEIFNRVVQDHFIHPENGIIRVFLNFIPREIWPDKPLPMQIELARAYNPSGFESGGGVFAGFYGDAYANAGIIGVILLPFLVGLLLNKAHHKAVYQPSKGGTTVAFYAVLVVYFVNAYRGYFSDMTWQVIFLYSVFWFLNKLEEKLNRTENQ